MSNHQEQPSFKQDDASDQIDKKSNQGYSQQQQQQQQPNQNTVNVSPFNEDLPCFQESSQQEEYSAILQEISEQNHIDKEEYEFFKEEISPYLPMIDARENQQQNETIKQNQLQAKSPFKSPNVANSIIHEVATEEENTTNDFQNSNSFAYYHQNTSTFKNKRFNNHSSNSHSRPQLQQQSTQQPKQQKSLQTQSQKLPKSQSQLQPQSQTQQEPLTLKNVFSILNKDYFLRSDTDLLDLHKYFITNNKFFAELAREKPQQDLLGLYRSINLEFYGPGECVFNYGDAGDCFYVIISGQVDIKVPTEISVDLNNYFEIFNYIILNYNNILKYKDTDSKNMKRMIEIIGYQNIKEQIIFNIDELYFYLKQHYMPPYDSDNYILKWQDDQSISFIYEQVLKLRDKRAPFINFQDYKIIFEIFSAIIIQKENQQPLNTSSASQQQSSPYQLQVLILKTVAKLSDGKSFGELALLTDQPRIASVYTSLINNVDHSNSSVNHNNNHGNYQSKGSRKSQRNDTNQNNNSNYNTSNNNAYKTNNKNKSENKNNTSENNDSKVLNQSHDNQVVFAVINKNDYIKYIGDSFLSKMKKAIRAIQKYEIFNKIGDRKLQDLFYFIEEKNYTRNQYVFKEEDNIDGVYFLVQGEVAKLKNIDESSIIAGSSFSLSPTAAGRVSDGSLSCRSNNKNVMSIIEGNEILGLEEIILGKKKRLFSIQVRSEKVSLMYFKLKDFRERILIPFPNLCKQLLNQYAAKDAFYQQRITQINQFKTHKILQNYQGYNINSQSNSSFISQDKQLSIFAQDEKQKFIKNDQRAKFYYHKKTINDKSFQLIQKALNQDKIETIQTKIQENYNNNNNNDGSNSGTRSLSRSRQPKQLQSNQYSPLARAAGNQNVQQFTLTPLRTPKYTYQSFLFQQDDIRSNTNNNNYSQLQQPIKKNLSSLSLRGITNEHAIIREYQIQNAKYSEQAINLEAITQTLNRRVDKEVEFLRHKKEKKLAVQYLQQLKNQNKNNNQSQTTSNHNLQENNNKHIGKRTNHKNKIDESFPSFLQEDTEDMIDTNLQTYEDMYRQRQLDKIREQQYKLHHHSKKGKKDSNNENGIQSQSKSQQPKEKAIGRVLLYQKAIDKYQLEMKRGRNDLIQSFNTDLNQYNQLVNKSSISVKNNGNNNHQGNQNQNLNTIGTNTSSSKFINKFQVSNQAKSYFMNALKKSIESNSSKYTNINQSQNFIQQHQQQQQETTANKNSSLQDQSFPSPLKHQYNDSVSKSQDKLRFLFNNSNVGNQNKSLQLITPSKDQLLLLIEDQSQLQGLKNSNEANTQSQSPFRRKGVPDTVYNQSKTLQSRQQSTNRRILQPPFLQNQTLTEMQTPKATILQQDKLQLNLPNKHLVPIHGTNNNNNVNQSPLMKQSLNLQSRYSNDVSTITIKTSQSQSVLSKQNNNNNNNQNNQSTFSNLLKNYSQSNLGQRSDNISFVLEKQKTPQVIIKDRIQAQKSSDAVFVTAAASTNEVTNKNGNQSSTIGGSGNVFNFFQNRNSISSERSNIASERLLLSQRKITEFTPVRQSQQTEQPINKNRILQLKKC